MTTVACCQVSLNIDRPTETAAAVLRMVELAIEKGAEVVVAPELANTGYCFDSVKEAKCIAEMQGKSFLSSICEISERSSAVVVVGFAELDGNEVYSSAAVVDAGKLVGVYRKTHLWNHENEVFAKGCLPPLVINTSKGCIATAVCYDIEFSEVVRMAAMAGAYLLAAPVNWPMNRKPDGFRWPIEIHKAIGNAAEHRISIAIADRVGDERGVSWEGGSIIINENGWPISTPSTEETLRSETIITAKVNPQPIKQLNKYNNSVTDRREDIYSSFFQQ